MFIYTQSDSFPSTQTHTIMNLILLGYLMQLILAMLIYF
jgi:hypothetical protein